ncbi:MAG: FKBP-type peptidyl-prolyl cis-trans isomerase [Phycisphaeraceae bacterium]
MRPALTTLIIAVLVWISLAQEPTPAAPDPFEAKPRIDKKPQERVKGTFIKVEESSLTFDPRTVLRGNAGFGWGLGSVQVNILGRDGDACVFDYTDEEEGGFTIYHCRVALDQAVMIGVKNGSIVTSFALKDAKVIGGGNVLLPPQGKVPGLAVQLEQAGVPETDYVNYHADAIIGSGAAAQRGKRVAVRYRLFADRRFNSEYVDIKSTHELKCTLGGGDIGAGLEVAVSGMREGGRRFALLHMKVADLLVKQLGGVQPNTQLAIEIELLSVE